MALEDSAPNSWQPPVDASQARIAQAQATLPSAAADDSGKEPVQASPTGELQAPAARPATQPMQLQPSVTTPAVAPSSNARLHGFIGSVLSSTLKALAGAPPVKYTTDADGRVIKDPNQPIDTNVARGLRLAQHAFEGLAAGAAVPQQRYGSKASALASGLGAGAQARGAADKAQDDKAKQEARDNQEAAEQKKLRAYQIGHLNATTYAEIQNAKAKGEEGLKAHYQDTQDVLDAAKEGGVEAQVMTPEQGAALIAKEKAAGDSAVVKHVVIGLLPPKPVLENGQPVLDEYDNPKMEKQIAVINEDQHGDPMDPTGKALVMSDALVKRIQRVAGFAHLSGIDSLKAGDTIPWKQFEPLITATKHAENQITSAKPEIVQVDDGNGGKKLQRRNPLGELSDPTAEEELAFQKRVSDIAKEQQEIKTSKSTEAKNLADTAKKQQELKQGATSNLTGEDYLKTLPVARQGIVRGVGEGRQALPANRKEALAILEDVHQSYPDFDESKGKTWQKTRNEYMGTGATAKALVSANTALAHLQRAFDHSTTAGIYNSFSKDYQALNADVTYIVGEVGKAVKGGVISEGEAQHIRESLNGGLTPGLKRERIKETATLLHDKMDETQTKFNDAAPSSAVKVPVLMHPSAGQAYDYIQNDGKGQSAPSPQSGQVQSAPAGATGKAKGSDGLWHYHDAKGNDLGVAH